MSTWPAIRGHDQHVSHAHHDHPPRLIETEFDRQTWGQGRRFRTALPSREPGGQPPGALVGRDQLHGVQVGEFAVGFGKRMLRASEFAVERRVTLAEIAEIRRQVASWWPF